MWQLADKKISSRLLIGSALYPSPDLMKKSITASGSEVVTVSLRRQNIGSAKTNANNGGNDFWNLLKSLNLNILPNTAGCHTAKEAVTTAQMAREVFDTNWIKLEVIGDEYNLQPDPFATLEATKELISQGFEVFPYCTDDLVLCQKLVEVGCKILMPWGSPIGTGKGLLNPYALKNIRERLPNITLIVDAGIGLPSHAVQALEMGYDGVLLNTAIAQAADPIKMAEAFKYALLAGRNGYEAGAIKEKNLAKPSTPIIGTPFWHQS